jgi:inward rectifier potassium channel
MPTRRPRKPRRLTRTSIGSLGFEFTKIGSKRFDLSDPYHLALTVRWPTFVAGVFCLYALITSLFGGLYLLQPGSITNTGRGTPADAFFFSIETLATVGYGVMAPATLYGHLVSSAEIITGMAFTAIMTGLIFVRFSKPRALILFSDGVVIARHNGVRTLMLRIGNGRDSLLAQTHVQLNALINEETREGGRFRRIHDLRLTRSVLPIFPLINTCMHPIDETSPLANVELETLSATDIRLIVSVQARDPQLGAVVHELKSYSASDIRVGMRFLDAVTVEADGLVMADLTRISEIEPDPAWDQTP